MSDHDHAGHDHSADGPGRHDHSSHDHGPFVWRVLMRWLHPMLYRNPPSNQFIVGLAGLGSEDRSLDIGCGPGAAVRAAAPLTTESVGVDPAARMLRVARRRSAGFANVRYEQAPADHLPFGDGEFTIAWTIHSLHHWGDQAAGLAEAHRVLAPGGRLLVMEALEPAKPWGVDEAGVERIRAIMANVGFSAVESTVHRVGKFDEVVISAKR